MFNENQPGTVTLSSKTSFLLGLVGGVLVLCTIGFFILLGVVLKGGVSVGQHETAKVTAPTANAPTANAPTANAGDENKVGEVAPIDENDHVYGNKKADTTLFLYTDLQCPYCARFDATVQQLLADKTYAGKVRLVIRHFPLSFHPNAPIAATAAECAGAQGKFIEYVNKVFENNAVMNGETFDKAVLSTWAKEVGLNVGKFDSCVSADKYAAKIANDKKTGAAANVSGTPATIIVAADGSKTLIPGALPIEQVKSMIDSVIK